MKNNGNTEFYQKAKLGQLSVTDIFSDVFKPHSKRAVEQIFTAGMPSTTPKESQMLCTWYKPWMFFRLFVAGVVLIILLEIMTSMGYGQYSFVANVFISAFIMPITVLVLYMELNIPRNIALYEVAIMLLAGGILSLIFTGVFKKLVDGKGGAYAFISEEPAKLLALCIFLRKPDKKYILNGILIGGTIGAGFAAIETTGYCLNYGSSVLFARGILAPGGHVAWAALYGGALAIVKGSEQLQAKHFCDFRFLKYFLISCFMHFLWNSDFSLYYFVIGNSAISLKHIILTIIIWIFLIKMISQGVNQISEISYYSNPNSVQYYEIISPTEIVGISGVYTNSTIKLINGQRIVFGRDNKLCNIIFPPNVEGVSRTHCTIYFERGSLYICDNGSTYGTFKINGTRIYPNQPVVLNRGDIFYLANRNNMFEIR